MMMGKITIGAMIAIITVRVSRKTIRIS